MQEKQKTVVQYVIIGLCMFCVSLYRIFPVASPFLCSLTFALLLCDYNCYLLLAMFFIAGVAINFSVPAVIILVSQMLFLLLLYCLKVFTNKKHHLWIAYLLLCLSQTAVIYFNLNNLYSALELLLCLFLTIVSFYVYHTIIAAMKKKGYYAKFALDEKLAMVFCVLTIFMGLEKLQTNVDVSKIFAIFLILLASGVLAQKNVFVLAVTIGLASSVVSGVSSKLALLPTLAVLCCFFTNKYAKAMATVMCNELLVFLLSFKIFFDIIDLACIVAVCLIYLCLPQKLLCKIRDNVGQNTKLYLSDYLELSQRKATENKLMTISNAFAEINRQYKNLIIGELDENKAIDFVTEKVINGVCESCSQKKECYRDQYVKSGIESLIKIGLKKDKLSLIDTPLQISSCKRVSQLSSVVWDNVSDIKNYAKTVKSQDNKTMAISNQFLGTSELLLQLCENSYDLLSKRDNEQKTIDALALAGITAKEMLEIYDENTFKEVCLICKNEDITKKELARIVSRTTKKKLFVSKSEMTGESGWSVVRLSAKPKLEQIIGVATSSRYEKEKNGDSYLATKIGDKRYILALADGMGNGKQANSLGDATLNLVESFYKAGLPSNMIARCVNNIMLPVTNESFSALDMIQFNSDTGEVDFVKMGASVSILKHKTTCEVISGASLPVGVIEKSRPTIVSTVVESGDVIVLASDGIVDSFSSIDNYAKFVNNENIQNMQLFAESIMEEACARKKDFDDRTVLAIRFV